MKRIILVAAFLAIGHHAEIEAQDLPLFDSALAQIGQTVDDVRFDNDETAVWGNDLWRLRFFTMLHRNPFKLPKYGRLTADALTGQAANPAHLISICGRMIDHPIRRGLIGDQLEPYLVYPDTINPPSITRGKSILTKEKYTVLRDKIDLLYRMADDDHSLFKRGIEHADKSGYRRDLFEYFIGEEDTEDIDSDKIRDILGDIDFDLFYAGAQDIAEAAWRVADSIEYQPFPDVVKEFRTRKGLIVIGTPGPDEYLYLDPPFMILDGGGDDRYEITGYPDEYPATIIIDAGGNDTYVSNDPKRPGVGGAILGLAIVIDKSGNDRYEGINVAQGCGIFGVGMLFDLGGDDVYTARTVAQGAGLFGIGVLSDLDGNDSLYCLQQAQGFGYTRGCGALINLAGDDRYVAEDDSIFDASSQSPDHNSSLAQGVGFGKRADFIDGRSWAGGVGILFDAAGQDRYSAGLFAQGCAYWYSVGMLLDGGGDDRYDGIWYVQGAGAHFGVALLDEFGGNDTYRAEKNMALGAGHDFTIGYLNERGGNDDYTAPNLSLGGGNANGIGIFHDHMGDDIYRTTGGTTLGRANGQTDGVRAELGGWGVFVDGGGEDTYNEDYAGNSRRWIGPPSKPGEALPFEFGVGIDK